MIQWFEELPDQCPPSDAKDPNGETYYRLCKSNSPCDEDFHSQRKNHPDTTWNGITECIARSVSIFNSLSGAVKLQKTPAFKHHKIGKIVLSKDDGLVFKSGRPSHYSWWRSVGFDSAKCYIDNE